VTLLVGLVLVLTARGCDGLALRNIAGLKAKLELAQNALKDEEYADSHSLEQQVADTGLTQAKRDAAAKDLEKVRDKYAKVREERSAGEWHNLTTAARDAMANSQYWGYWREVVFVVGTILLAVGLIALMLFGLNVERYLAFGMLAIIVFSVYIGGTAWLSSVVGTMSGLAPGLR
jgi:hypothetical protein